MKEFYTKKNYEIGDIYSLINNEVEESVYLDFKSGEALGKSDGKKKEVSKDVASFANSDGGIIIYGIRETDHKAGSISYIDGNVYTKEWLEHIINATIQRRIDEIEIIPIRENNEIDKTIYLVKIPKSMDAPHMSRDKRFYKRFNFESVAMEEHEIRQLYGKRAKSKLRIQNWRIHESKQNALLKKEEKREFSCTIDISNIGDLSEDNYKVNVIFENIQGGFDMSWGREQTSYSYTIMSNYRIKFSAQPKISIFPKETATVARFKIEIPRNEIEKYFDVNVKIYLLYANGMETYETDIKRVLQKKINNG